MQSLDRLVEEEVQNNQFFSRVGYHQLQTKQLGPIASNSRFTLASPLLYSFWLCWEPSRSKAGFINCGKNLNCLIIGRESSFHYTVRFRGMAIDYNCLWNEIHIFFVANPWSSFDPWYFFAISWSSYGPWYLSQFLDHLLILEMRWNARITNPSITHLTDLVVVAGRPKNFFRTPGILIWWNFVINGRSTQMRCKSFII